MAFSFVFPGQGSQSVGMMDDLAAGDAVVRETFEDASDVLGFDLWDLAQNGPAEQLNKTVITQPVMLAAGVATWRAWRNAGGPMPSMMAGHSLGEYSALTSAGAVAFGDAMAVVRQRSELMQAAVPEGEGAMAAVIGLSDEAIIEVCNNASGIGVAEPVNFNSPGQVAVAGHRGALERVVELAREAGARRAIMLPVSVPSHSSLLTPAGEKLAGTIDEVDFRPPEVPVISGVDGKPYVEPDDIRVRIRRQLYSPVYWVDAVRYIVDAGITQVFECGPGKVLSGLNKRIDRSLRIACLDSTEAVTSVIEEVKT